jgi:hypothetical protein
MIYQSLCCLAIGGILAASHAAKSAPFCFSTESVPPLCIYYDAYDCQKESSRQGGICTANPKELRLATGTGQYCVVTSSKTSFCAYLDRASCFKDAVRQHGACVVSPQRAPSGAPDPYATTYGGTPQ